MGQISTEIIQKANMQKIIDKEHGKEYHKNVNLSGYTVYRGDSFITFRFVTLGKNARVCVYIDYIYVTSRTNLIKLLAWCMNFWAGNGTKCIYYASHKRKANFVEKTFPSLDFKVNECTKSNNWKYEWKSTNGFSEDQIIEAFVS